MIFELRPICGTLQSKEVFSTPSRRKQSLTDDMIREMDDNFRKANWTEESISTLVDLVTDLERWAVIQGKFSPSLTVQKKQRIWEEIAERYFF